jgi:hypothetical protein
MADKVLVAYASKYGATAQIAEKIALRLTSDCLSAVAQDVNDVTSLSDYKGIILGSGVYMGMWMKEAAEFLKDHEFELAKMPVWFFSDGPTGTGDPMELMKGWRFPRRPETCCRSHQTPGYRFLSRCDRHIQIKICRETDRKSPKSTDRRFQGLGYDQHLGGWHRQRTQVNN